MPLRNVPVIAPPLPLDGEIDRSRRGRARDAAAMLKRLDLNGGEQPVAVFVPWQGSATFQRLDAFCRGVVEGLSTVLANGHPLVLAGDGDVGGLLGIHLHEEMKLTNPVVSIDGLELKEFDYIDIGAMLESSGAVPVVIKSLIFPGSAVAGAERVGPRVQVHTARQYTSSWPGLSRPSTIYELGLTTQTSDGRDKPGHDVGEGSAKER